MDVPDPCVDVDVYLTTIYETRNRSTAEVTIAQWPNVQPVFEGNKVIACIYSYFPACLCIHKFLCIIYVHTYVYVCLIQKVWNAFEWERQNFTIQADDPGFKGGYSCGPNDDQLCKLFIGVLGYCTEAGEQAVSYELTVTQKPTTGRWQTAMNDLAIAAGETKRFEFCVSEPGDVQLQLQSYDDACECPNSYVNMEVGVSRTQKSANFETDKLWKLSATDYDKNSIDLKASDVFTGVGTYYVQVYGQCNANTACDESDGDCTCEPCANYDAARYSIATDMLGGSTFDSLALSECPVSTSTCLA